MGRARGKGGDRTGQPAPGRGVRPKILDELQEIGGMSPAWHARNHLVQEALGEVDVPRLSYAAMNDRDLLEEIKTREVPVIGGLVLHTGDTLHNPDANNREYRGQICVGADISGNCCYQGVTEWGRAGGVGSHRKVIYTGPSIQEAAQAVNAQIRKKLDKGYQGQYPEVNASKARTRIEEIISDF